MTANSGQFKPGHPFPPGAGRPLGPESRVRRALIEAEKALPGITKAMVERALNDDHKDCQRAGEYLWDRLEGKVVDKLQIGGVLLVVNADQLQLAAQQIEGDKEREKQLGEQKQEG